MANLKDILAKVREGVLDKGINIPTEGGGTSKTTSSRVASTYRLPPGGTEQVLRASTTTPGVMRSGTILNVPDSYKKNILGLSPGELLVNVEEMQLDKFKSKRVPPMGYEFVGVKPFRPTEMTFKDWYTNTYKKDIIRTPKDLAEIKYFNTQNFLKAMNEGDDLTKLKGGTGMAYKTYTKDALNKKAIDKGYILALPDVPGGPKTQSLERFVGQQFDAIDKAQVSNIKFGPMIGQLKKDDPQKYKILTNNFAKERIKFAMESVVDGVSVDAVMEAKKELGDKFDFNSAATKKVIARNFKRLLRPALWGPAGVMAVITEGLAAGELNPEDQSLETKQRIERGEVYTMDEQAQREMYRENPEVAKLIREGADLSPRIQGMDPLGLMKPKKNKKVDSVKETGIMTIDEVFK